MTNRAVVSVILVGCLLLAGCAQTPPKHQDDVCKIFKERPKWYWASKRSKKRWGVPINVIMAFMYQESRFHANARPPRKNIFGIIPWFRESTSYGYAQALTSTWQRYENDANRFMASRTSFADSADFIGWYAKHAHDRAGLDPSDAYSVYLAYHEGIGGYIRHSHRNNNKQWVRKVARKVKRRSNMYKNQLKRCQNSLPKEPWWHLLF